MLACDIVTFLDSDDEAEPDWLETILQPSAEDVGIVCAGMTIVDDSGARADLVKLPENGGPLYANQIVHYMPGTFAVRKSILLSVGGYRNQAARQQKELGRRITQQALDEGFSIVAVPLLLICGTNTLARGIRTDPQAVYQGTLSTIEYDGADIRAKSRS